MATPRLITLAAVFAIGSVAAVIAIAGGEGTCDLKTVTKGVYCEYCECIVPAKDLVSDVTHYVCADCEEVSSEPGTCRWCEAEFTKKVSGKKVCGECFRKPTEVEVCEKSCYACPDCGMTSGQPGDCAECEVALEKEIVRAVIHYVCPECGTVSLKPGNCDDETCEHHGKALRRECARSGEFPHGGSE